MVHYVAGQKYLVIALPILLLITAGSVCTYPFFFFFFPSSLMSICNPLGYDRPECLYIHDQAWPKAPYLYTLLNEADVIQDGIQVQDTYPTLFQRLFDSKLIKIMACSIWWDSPSSGSLLLGGVDTAKFSGDLITIPIVKENGSYQHLKVVLSDSKLSGVRRPRDPSQFSKRAPINVFFATRCCHLPPPPPLGWFMRFRML